MAIRSAVDTSCAISAIGNSGARSAGPIGCFVPGCNGGDGGFGIDGTTLNHAVGIWLSRSVNLVARVGIAPPFARLRLALYRRAAAHRPVRRARARLLAIGTDARGRRPSGAGGPSACRRIVDPPSA